MIPEYILKIIKDDSAKFTKKPRGSFFAPEYDPDIHYLHLTNSNYYFALIHLRDYIKLISDYYFSVQIGAKNIDLFMLTTSVSSPMGPGSNSEAIPIRFGNLDSYLVDSSQFGFEPLLLNGIDKAYCYLPSMRGENFDKRHLNQFFHCEMEMVGERDEIKKIVEGYIKVLCLTLLESKEIVNCISVIPEKTIEILNKILDQEKFEEISFDDAVTLLEKNDKKNLVNYTENGRDISSEGEIELMRLLGTTLPIWINDFDRDRVPFYQKPIGDSKAMASDLLFPPLHENAFGGEIVGCGQRQDLSNEIYESLQRQKLDVQPYDWYINLRRQDNYRISSGFGLGIERFIAWSLGMNDIKNAIIYPRLKGINTNP